MPSIFAIADGMGGHAGGAIASQIAIDSIRANAEQINELVPEDLPILIDSANEDIGRFLNINPGSAGLGTTLVLILLKDEKVFWSSVGDSALLLLQSNHNAIRLNEDHSMRPVIEKMKAEGLQSSSEFTALNNKGNMLRSALLGSKIELIDSETEGVPLLPDSWIIALTDGAESLYSDESHLREVSTRGSISPDFLCSSFVDGIETHWRP